MIRRARFVALAIAVAACRAGGVPIAGTSAGPDACLIPAGRAPADTVTVGVEGGMHAATLALRPLTQADSFVFAQVYETLVRVTCDGALVPALAERWQGDSTGRAWTLYLRSDATFHDGSPVTATDVAAAWRARRFGVDVAADPRLLAVEGVTLESERVLTVHLRDADRAGPRLLADAYYAVHRAAPDSGAAVGTGRYIVDSVLARPGALTTAHLAPRGSPAAAPVISLLRSPGGDARDLIDAGIDALMTTDRRVIDYAATRPELSARPLPPDRAYVLVSAATYSGERESPLAPPDVHDSSHFPSPADSRWQPLRDALARDVLRDVRGQRIDGWWMAESVAAGCAPEATPSSRGGDVTRRRAQDGPRVIYRQGDTIAAAIANRLVALATETQPASAESRAVHELFPELVTPNGAPLTARSSSGDEVTSSLFARSDLAYVIALPRRALDACAAWRALAARVPWIGPSRVAFLVETGPTLITSPRAPALTLDWNNTLRIHERRDGGRRPR